MTKPENCGTGHCSCVECVVDSFANSAAPKCQISSTWMSQIPGLTDASVRGIFATGLAHEVNGWPTRTRLERVFVIPAKPLAASGRQRRGLEQLSPISQLLLCTLQVRFGGLRCTRGRNRGKRRAGRHGRY